MEELAAVLSNFGVMGLWGVVLYKVLDFLEFVGAFFILYYVAKKCGPKVIKLIQEIS